MHLLSDCRQHNNLVKGSELCEAWWAVNRKPRVKEVFGGGGKINPEVGLKGELEG